MSEMFNPRAPTTAYDHHTTIVAVLELSGKSWLFGAVAPGVARRTKRSFEARDLDGVVRALEQLKAESAKAGFQAARFVLGYEAGRDGFWIARALQQVGIEVYVMHPASIAVERRGKRAKTDRLDVDLLLTTLIGWLRGEPGRCTMSPIPTEEEEDLREPGRRRETLVQARLKVENQMASLLIRYGIAAFKPRLKGAEKKLDELKTFDGRPLPANTMNSLRLLMAQHRLVSAQLKTIEEARQRVVDVVEPNRLQLMILTLARVVGVGVETATVIVYEVFSRQFKDRRALAAFIGVTGTPYDSGGSRTEQGISKNGNPRVRRMLSQLAWRWLIHQPESALAQWYRARLAGAKGRMKKILIVALMRKLVIALWRLVETGEVPAGVRLAAA
jgi:transposase